VAAKKNRRALRVGVTGGIGSGKTIVCDFFRKLGAVVLSADEIGRELSESNAKIKEGIREEFGRAVIKRNGRIDRKKLAEVVFKNREKRGKLNAIIHPFVLKEIERRTREVEEKGAAPLIIHEAALIYEAGADRNLDFVVVVDADEETRIKRVLERDGVSRSEVLRRINSQMPASKKKQLADFVISNNGDIRELGDKVKFLYNLFLKISAKNQ
jgi:dephospho-CoA kinase